MDVNERSDAWASDQVDVKPGNRPDMNLIMDNAGQRNAKDTSDIRVDLINDFNNGVFLVVLAKLSYIIPDKHVIDSSARIFTDVINNP